MVVVVVLIRVRGGNCDFTATGRYSVVGVDVLDTHALVQHRDSFVFGVHLDPSFGKYIGQYLRFEYDVKSIDYCDPIEMFAANFHLHVSNQTIYKINKLQDEKI